MGIRGTCICSINIYHFHTHTMQRYLNYTKPNSTLKLAHLLWPGLHQGSDRRVQARKEQDAATVDGRQGQSGRPGL